MRILSTYLFLVFFSLFGLTKANGQENTVEVKGLVWNESKGPLDLVTVSLLHLPDSAFSASVYTNEQGNYIFSKVKQGQYVVVASMMGYGRIYQPVRIAKEAKGNVEVPPITLTAEAQALGEVTVTAQKPVVERRDGALVVNVANTALAAGNTAFDILQRSPGVSVDRDGNISLMGRQGVTVMIDGKQTYLSAEQLANLLRSMDGNNIQSIELNTNPSAKYDAAGTAGIINIKLKKNKMEGTNGSITLSGGYGKTHKSNTSLQLNHKVGKFNFFGNYSYLNNDSKRDLGLLRTTGQADELKTFDQYVVWRNKRESHNARVGIDYQTSERNTLSALFSGFFLTGKDRSTSDNYISALHGPIDSTLSTLNTGNNNYKNLSFNLNNTFNIDTNGRKLAVEMDISRFNDKTKSYYDNYFYNPDGQYLRDPEFIFNDMPSVIDIQTAKADYTHPFNKQSKLEAGVKFARVKSDNNMGFFDQEDGIWQNNEDRSNHFIYTERVSAAYAIYNYQLKKTEIKAGLRVEHTYSDGNSITLGMQNKRNYFSFFPNVSINQQLSDKHSVGLSYSRRINRPNYGNLNPFLFYVDPYSYQQGNPFLNPSFTNSYELSYTLLKKYTLTAGYQKTSDMVGEVMYQNDATNVLIVTNENIANEKVYFMNFNIPVAVGKWNSNTNINALHLGYKAAIPDAPIDFGQYGVQVNSNHTYNLGETVRLEANVQYQSKLRWSIYQIGSSWGLDLGVNKSFWDKKGQLKLAVSDIFFTNNNTVRTDYSNLNIRIRNTNETRVARLTFTYNFGNQKLKTSQRNLDNSEKNRVGK